MLGGPRGEGREAGAQEGKSTEETSKRDIWDGRIPWDSRVPYLCAALL